MKRGKMSRSRAAALALALAGGPAAAQGAAPLVAPGWEAVPFAVSGTTPLTGFAVDPGGFALVPLDGGVALAGLDGWLVEPRVPAVEAVASSPRGTLIFAQRTRDGGVAVRRAGASAGRLGVLPDGTYQLDADGESGAWAWGREAAGAWGVWHLAGGAAPTRVYGGAAPAMAVAPLGQGSAVMAVGNQLLLVRRGAAPQQIARLRDPIEGLAPGPGESLYLSTGDGLYHLVAPGVLVALSGGIHGPVQVNGDAVYVLDRARRSVVRLRPVPAGQPGS
jgi:hypothetical protein